MSSRIEYRAFTATYDDIVDDLLTPAAVLPADDEASDIAPVEVTAMWDTGAAVSCITQQLKNRLNLPLLDMDKPVLLAGIGGEVHAPTTVINIRLVSDAEIVRCPVNVVDFPGDVDLIIGMDIIGMGDFAICNTDGKTSFSFALPPFPDRINFAEKAETANKQQSV